MFNLLKKLFKKKEKQEEKKEVSIDSLKEFSEKLESELFQNNKKQIEKIQDAAEEIKRDINEVGVALRNAKAEEEIEQNLKKKVISARDNVSDRLNYIYSHMSIPKINSWADITWLREELNKIMNEIRDLISKKGELIKIGFKKQRGMIDTLAVELANALSDIDNLLSENHDKLYALNVIKEKWQELINLNNQIKNTESKLEEKQKEMNDLTSNQKYVEAKIDEIEKSNEFKRKIEIKNKINELENKKLTIENEFRNELNFTIKALKKYIHFYGGLIEKDELKWIKNVIEEPTRLLESTEEKINELLERVKDNITRDNLKFDEKTKNRILNDTENIPEIVSSTKDKTEQINSEIDRLSKELESISLNDYENLKETLKVSKQWINKLKNEIPELEKRLEEKEEKLEEIMIEIIDAVEKGFGIKLEIK
jgi:DNA repair exonuclease SbcCD ATPase subunit